MGEWQDRHSDWEYWMDQADGLIQSGWSAHADIDTFESAWTDPELNANFAAISTCLFKLLSSMAYMTSGNIYDPENRLFGRLSYLLDYGFEAEPVAITWKDIMKAWWDAPIAGWGWTIQFIDFMRKAVWNEPLNIIEQEEFM